MHLLILIVLLVPAGTILIQTQRGKTLGQALADTCSALSRLFHYIKQLTATAWERSQSYPIYIDLTPYLEEVRVMKLFRYIRFSHCGRLNRDVAIFYFEVIGIHPEYKDDMGVLRDILSVKLRDFYLDAVGPANAPAIYLSDLREGKLAFWVSENLHGRRLVLQKIAFDLGKGRPQGEIHLPDGNTVPGRLLLGYDLGCLEAYRMQKPIAIDLKKLLMFLICGSTGSGKSYFVNTYLLRNLLESYKGQVILYYCTFKPDADSEFLASYRHYYAGGRCGEGITRFYQEEYLPVRDGKRDGKIRLLFFDEWAGFQIWETQKSKKQAELYKGMLQEILSMGRSLLCGAWVSIQRPDSAFIQGRECFQVTCCFLSGGVSNELARMIGLGEETMGQIRGREVFCAGEAVVKIDGERTKFLKVPNVGQEEAVRRQILESLTRADGAAGSTGAGAPPS